MLPPPAAPQPYGYGAVPPMVLPEASGATPAMVLGIISLVVVPLACCCGIGAGASIILGLIAVVFGIMARNRVNASGGTLGGGGKAMAGIITGGIAVALAVIGAIIYIALIASSGSIVNYLNSFITPTPT